MSPSSGTLQKFRKEWKIHFIKRTLIRIVLHPKKGKVHEVYLFLSFRGDKMIFIRIIIIKEKTFIK